MQGLMMDVPLLITDLIRFADRNHGDTEIVSKTVEGGIHRYTYREAHARARRLAKALQALGVKSADRVGTLAWNGYRHYELYYAISGIGAVINTINPRLFAEQIVYISNHAENQALFFDLTFLPLVEKLAPQLKTVKHYVLLTDRAHMPAQTSIPKLQCYEELMDKQDERFEWPSVRRAHRGGAVLHLGHHGQPEGRALRPPLHGAARLRRGAARRARPLGARRGAAGGADVPRQRLEPALRLHHGGREDGVPGPAPGRQERLRADRAGKGDAVGRRAHGVADAAAAPGARNKVKFSTLKRTVIGGSACPPAMIRAFQDDYGVTVFHAWGMTEMSPLGTVGSLKAKQAAMPKEQRYAVQAKQGRGIFGVEMKIVDEGGKELPWDGKAFGDLLVQGPLDRLGLPEGRGRRPAARTAGSRPATSPPSTPTATCRSPTAPRT